MKTVEQQEFNLEPQPEAEPDALKALSNVSLEPDTSLNVVPKAIAEPVSAPEQSVPVIEEAKPRTKRIGRTAVKKVVYQPLRESLEASNPALGELAGRLIDQLTDGLKPLKAKKIGDAYFRKFLEIEETSHPTLSVSLKDRATNLRLALIAISRNHSNGGLGMATSPGSKYIGELMTYFKTSRDGVEIIGERASFRRKEIYEKAQRHFADAIGHKLVEESGLIDARDNDNMTSHDFIELVREYYIKPDHEARRGKYLDKLKKISTRL